MIVLDSSVAVAAALPWHEAHAVARAEAAGGALVAHAAVETYSVLTRLPLPWRVPAAVAAEYLARAFPPAPVALSQRGYSELLDRVARDGIVGGAVYDAVVAATAGEAGATLLTLDRRAVPTYARLGVDYRLLG